MLSFQNIVERLILFPKVISRNINRALPFIATENRIIAMVKIEGNIQVNINYIL